MGLGSSRNISAVDVSPRERFENPGDRPWALATFALLISNILIRGSPLFFCSDAVGIRLCAFQIRGWRSSRLCSWGVHHGSASCYLSAAFFALIGPNRAAGANWPYLRSTLSDLHSSHLGYVIPAYFTDKRKGSLLFPMYPAVTQ